MDLAGSMVSPFVCGPCKSTHGIRSRKSIIRSEYWGSTYILCVADLILVQRAVFRTRSVEPGGALRLNQHAPGTVHADLAGRRVGYIGKDHVIVTREESV